MADPASYTEKELLCCIAEGDEQAFRYMFGLYRDVVYSAACKWLEAADQAEDIVQEVFLKLWQGRANCPKIENLKVYILVATKNHVFNVFKKNSRIAALLGEIRHEYNKEENGTTELLNYKETFFILQQAVDRLPPQQKQVFSLGKMEGYKLDEIASSLAISIVTVNKHMALAVRSVKNYLVEHDGAFTLILLAFLSHPA